MSSLTVEVRPIGPLGFDADLSCNYCKKRKAEYYIELLKMPLCSFCEYEVIKNSIHRAEHIPSQTKDTYWIFAYPDNVYFARPRAGKWLVFVKREDLDSVWERVKCSTELGELGFASKTATFKDNPDVDQKYKVICVYTNDYADLDDVARVCFKLMELGVANDVFNYKSDQATINGSTKSEYSVKPKDFKGFSFDEFLIFFKNKYGNRAE